MLFKKIGIFDSGMGGLNIVKAIHQAFPSYDLVFYGDSAYAPYGTKKAEIVYQRCVEITDLLVNSHHCDIIVIACNTATSVAIDKLRDKFKIPIIGMQPVIEEANITNNDLAMVWATPLTIDRPLFKSAIKEYPNILSVKTPSLVEIVENDQLENGDLVNQALINYLNNQPINKLILGCTHFIYFEKYLKKLLPNVQIYNGTEQVINSLDKLLTSDQNNHIGQITLINSDENKNTLMNKLFTGK